MPSLYKWGLKRASTRTPNYPALLAIRSLRAGPSGAFLVSARGYRYLYVAIDKFTKWPEVEPVRTIPAKSAVKFIRGLLCRFGVPNRIIIDNSSQFTSGVFKSYCGSLDAQICYASVAHPRSNG